MNEDKRDERQDISPDIIARLIQNLERGRYVGPLEIQPINWTDTKIYRDLVQNFFDGMKEVAGRPTLSGVDFSDRMVKDGAGQSAVEFTIRSPAKYDHRYLIHHGGTTKAGDETVVGEFGEGLKIASFLLIKNGVTEQIELGSDHWKAYYYFQELPPDEYPGTVKGLYLRAEFVEDSVGGNFLRFSTNEDAAQGVRNHLIEMKNFFWHEGNPDFCGPTYQNEFGGFKILPKGQNGNLYAAGQRHEYGRPEVWSNAVYGAHVWTFKKALEGTRDRNYAVDYEVTSKILEPLIHSMAKADLLKVFYEGSEYWLAIHGLENTVVDTIMGKVITRLSQELSGAEKQELLVRLSEDIFAKSNLNQDKEYEKMLEGAGFRKVISAFKGFGVLTAKEKILSLVDTAKESTLESWENDRVEILNQATRVFISRAGSSIIDRYLEFLKSPVDKWIVTDSRSRLSVISVLSNLKSKKIPALAIRETDSLRLREDIVNIQLHGFTNLFPKNIFLQRRILQGDFLGALLTWTHEFAHNISGEDDYTAKFADTERYLHELLLIINFEDDELKNLQDAWGKTSAHTGSETEISVSIAEDIPVAQLKTAVPDTNLIAIFYRIKSILGLKRK
ncbi:MAG: hypothetical protein A3A97_00215 [Candidatus Terrybacteria bacterium RIFCSPLOWO2_01_FULL_40_23]|uniref:Uncharacterized protein n=1 Tax=Candidatus Terrybacteria bacterium RIFCSPLOWO2_01_FULL_40_23 TaxID=1802366 RepID=A0A1G2PW71_9BACT|nr:MAG: hypothetical protein A3A97_00215 [Candidatus Terrybacteria bacterium RIFCSPLOWO2_01_FULL_40_23]